MLMRFLVLSIGLVVTFVELIAPHASVLTILAISFERYYAICQPLRAGYVCTKSRAMAISLFTWLCAGLLTRYAIEFVRTTPRGNTSLLGESKMVSRNAMMTH